jgi:hypothetical protein
MGHLAGISSKTLWNLPSSSKNHFYIVTYYIILRSHVKSHKYIIFYIYIVLLDHVKIYKYIYFYTCTVLHGINKFTQSVSPKPFTYTKLVWTSGSWMDSFDDNFTFFQIFLFDRKAVNNGAISWNIFLDKASNFIWPCYYCALFFFSCDHCNDLVTRHSLLQHEPPYWPTSVNQPSTDLAPGHNTLDLGIPPLVHKM